MFSNKTTKTVRVGNVLIGGGNPVSIQSMLNKKAHDIKGNVEQALSLEAAGCEIIRVSVPDKETLKTVYALKQSIKIPLVADIHFDWKLAVESVNAGVDKVRINPGNIGSEEGVRQVAKICSQKNIPIRIGVNSGSLEKNILAKYGKVCPKALVESGFYHIDLLRKYDFSDIVLSLKASNTKIMYDSYVLAAHKCEFPLHLGVTEAGTKHLGSIKSAAGIGGLLLRDIGDTVRISLTDNPIEEVLAAKDLLKGLNLRSGGIKFVSCPTCGRTEIDLISLAKKAEERFKNINKDLTVALMGCVVNGPGEARGADIGIAGGKKSGVLFKNGEILYKNIPEENLLDILEQEINKI